MMHQNYSVSGVCVSAPELAGLEAELDGFDESCLILCAIEYDGADGAFALSAAFLSAYAPRPPIAAPANPAAIALPTPDIDPH
jgi:hypothetical protein